MTNKRPDMGGGTTHRVITLTPEAAAALRELETGTPRGVRQDKARTNALASDIIIAELKRRKEQQAMIIYRVTFTPDSDTFTSSAINTDAPVEYVEETPDGDVWDIPTERPDALEHDLNACADVIRYARLD